MINRKVPNLLPSIFNSRLHSKIKPFKKHLTHVFEKLSKENKKLFIVGDFNINSINYSTNSTAKTFINQMFANGVLSVINKPTRITNKSVSCRSIQIHQDIFSGIIKTEISDHFPVFIIDNNIKTTNFPENLTKKIRIINNFTINNFKEKLSEVDWSLVLNTQDSNNAYDIFLKQFLNIHQKCFPMKTITTRRRCLEQSRIRIVWDSFLLGCVNLTRGL